MNISLKQHKPILGEVDSEFILNAINQEDLDDLMVLGCYGTSGNTSMHKGVNTQIEAHINIKLHCNVCFFI